MRRWLLHIMVCLLLGAITTVAVAWLCVRMFVVDLDATERVTLERRNELIRAYTPLEPHEVWQNYQHYGWATSGFGVRLEYSTTSPRPHLTADPFPIGQGNYRIFTWRAGFPLAALRGEWVHWYLHGEDPIEEYHGLIRVRQRGRITPMWEVSPMGDVLPIGPIAVGFITNTLVYAAIWMMPVVGVAFGRHHLRRRRGRCVRCGYDLRGHNPNGPHPRPLSPGERGVIGCPECGWGRVDDAQP